MAVLTGGLGALAQLMVMSVRATATAQSTTVSALAAQHKMEQLRADADLLAPGGSLASDAAGFSDVLDAQGQVVPGGSEGGWFVRRWVVEPASFDPSRTKVLRVRVVRAIGTAPVPPWPGSGLDESRLLTLITARER